MKYITFLLFAVSIMSCNNSQTASAKQAIADSAKRAQDSIANIIKIQQDEIKKLKDEKELDEQLKIEEEKQKILSNINEYLVTKPDYPDPGLGGIVNGKVHVKNNLKVTIQKATILVQVILDNGSVYSNEFYTIENIERGEVKTIDIPNTTRGTSVKSKVVKVKSQELTNGMLIDVQ
jgi:hypothetical protein